MRARGEGGLEGQGNQNPPFSTDQIQCPSAPVMLNRPPSRRSRECRHDFPESTDIDLGLSPSHSPRPHPNQNLLRRRQSWQLTWALGRYIGELRCAESQRFKVKLGKLVNCLMSIQSSTRVSALRRLGLSHARDPARLHPAPVRAHGPG